MTPAKQQRKYQVIWMRIKKYGHCTIEVHPALQPRVKKAVSKEKNQDAGFKLLNDHDHFYLLVTNPVINGVIQLSKLKFTLKQSLGLEGVVSDE